MLHRSPLILLLLAFSLAACSSGDDAAEADQAVQSYLEGTVRVRAEVDSIPDFSDFELLVAFDTDEDGEADTLGYAVTDTAGAFQMTVQAPERGIYPLLIGRQGTVLKVGELVVADADSAVLSVRLPDPSRLLRIRGSEENAAWASYRNARAQHNQGMLEMVQSGSYDETMMERRLQQAAGIMWSLQETFPGTIGAQLGAAEAVIMLDGWADSLAVARARSIDPENPRYVEVARAARRSQARRSGQAEAIALVQDFQARATDRDDEAALQAEIVVARMDSLEREAALEAAQTLKSTYGDRDDAPWAEWADRAIYELENLMPGMQAPAFTAATRQGEVFSLADQAGSFVVLEFMAPSNEAFVRELGARNALVEAAADLPIEYVSISVDPDSLLNEALFEENDLPGVQIVAPSGPEDDLVRQYNVNVLPTRFIIDRDGSIVGKYVGSALGAVQNDLATLLQQAEGS